MLEDSCTKTPGIATLKYDSLSGTQPFWATMLEDSCIETRETAPPKNETLRGKNPF